MPELSIWGGQRTTSEQDFMDQLAVNLVAPYAPLASLPSAATPGGGRHCVRELQRQAERRTRVSASTRRPSTPLGPSPDTSAARSTRTASALPSCIRAELPRRSRKAFTLARAGRMTRPNLRRTRRRGPDGGGHTGRPPHRRGHRRCYSTDGQALTGRARWRPSRPGQLLAASALMPVAARATMYQCPPPPPRISDGPRWGRGRLRRVRV